MLAAACSSNPPGDDAGTPDADADASLADGPVTPGDASPDAAQEAAADAGIDAPVDALLDTAADALPDAPPDAPVDASLEAAADASGDAAGDASADAASDATAPVVDYYVDPLKGKDTNDGSSAAPFKTIDRAAQVVNALPAGASPTIHLVDGTYDATTQPNLNVTFNVTTYVTGTAPGKAILLGQGTKGNESLVFNSGGGVRNVSFKNTAYGLQVESGTFTAAGVAFDGAGQLGYPMLFDNTAVATIDASGVVPFLTNIPSPAPRWNGVQNMLVAGCMLVQGNAAVTWKGVGAVTSAATVPCAVVSGNAPTSNGAWDQGNPRLAVDGANIQYSAGYAFVLDQAGQLSITSSTISNSGTATAAVWVGTPHGPGPSLGVGQNMPKQSLSLDHCSITGSHGSGIAFSVIDGYFSAGFLSITSSHIDANAAYGVDVGGLPSHNPSYYWNLGFTEASSTFDSNGAAGINANQVATFALSGGSISKNGANAKSLGLNSGGLTGGESNSLTMRNMTLSSNTGDAVDLNGPPSSTTSNPVAYPDLGTAASPGGNTFAGVQSGSSALVLGTDASGATAIGNTWMPNVQGADAQGRYTTSTTITGGNGLNVTASGSVVMAP